MTKNKKEEQTLIIGSTNHPGCDCIRWDKKDFPSAVDYHLIIVDCTTLPNENKTDFFPKNLEKLKRDLIDFLLAGHNIFVIADNKEIKIKSYNLGHEREAIINSFYWSPLPVVFTKRSGRHIEKVERFKKYFEFVEGWSFEIRYPSKDNLKYLYSRFNFILTYIDFVFVPFAYNPANRPIAVIEGFKVGKIRINEDIVKESGSVVIFPPPTKINSKKAIDFILKEIIGKYEELPPPDWIEDCKLPIDKILEKRGTLRKKIRNLYDESNKIEKQINELTIFKQLLYETGFPLENIIKKSFEFIGIPIGKPKYSKVDHSIEFGNVAFLLESKGKKDAIDIKDLRQLTSYIDEWYYEKKPSDPDCKGILVGNPWREVNPRERNQMFFTKDAVNQAKRSQVVLITTLFLFDLVVLKMKGKKINSKKLLSDLFESDSEFTKSAEYYCI